MKINLKVLKYSLIAIAVLILLLAASLGTYYGVAYNSDVKLSLQYEKTAQAIEGFGASSAWSYQSLGKEDDATIDEAVEMLYGDSGLGLSIFRYNIGGGSLEEKFDSVSPYSNDWFDIERRAESFFKAESFENADSFKNENNYDFTKDAAVMKVFRKALATGNIERVVFFANSPHYLMTESGKCTGEYEYQNNLKSEYYEAFSDYLTIIVKHIYENELKTLEKVPEVVISPVNEPQWKWGGVDATQEGCHFDPENLAAFYDTFIKTLNKFNTDNSASFVFDGFESGNYKFYPANKIDAADYLNAMSKYDYFKDLEHISVHTYASNDSLSIRTKFAKFMDKNHPNLKVSATEFCEMKSGRFDTIESGLFLAKVISRDLTMIDATDWSWWLSISRGDYNDGLVYWDKNEDNSNKLSVIKRYYTMAHFTKYLGSGDVRFETRTNIKALGLDVAAFKRTDGSTALIIINEGATRDIDLSATFATADIITTNASENLKEERRENVSSVTVEKNSIVTIILK